MHRLLMTSEAYQMAASHEDDAANESDPDTSYSGDIANSGSRQRLCATRS